MCKKLLILTSFVLVFGFAGSGFAIHASGNILFEYWFDIGGGNVADLTGHADYPDYPDDGELRDKFEGPVDWADSYGTRARGWLYPAEDGDYTFWISGDDFQDLYLSTDADPANAVLIAQVLGWTSHLEWDKYPEQKSEPITLAAGGQYYIEAIMKEGGGGDSMTVGWTGPGIGEEITIIDGAYLAPADWAPGLLKAQNPVPADGAVDVDVALLEWTSGKKSVSHVVYLNGELLAETEMNLVGADLAPGETYTWKVDEVLEDGTVIEGNTWSFTTLPLEAHFPSPADGAEDITSPVLLSWTPGKNTIINDVYFGTDEAAVAARDANTFKVKAIDTTYDTGPLDLFSTYYWAVDAFTPEGTVAGPVWSFSTERFVLVADEVTVDYDNAAEPYVTEVAVDTVADLTEGGAVSDLTLSFKGMSGNLSIDEETGVYEVTGAGADIWNNSDEFHYVHMNLTGDGTITARVVDNGSGSNSWAKGGVMIRQSLEGGSVHAMTVITGGSGKGAGFQWREVANEGSGSVHDTDPEKAPPYWVRLERVGNDFIGSFSPDGETWTEQGTITIEMADPVLIGLCVTSHASGEPRTFVFDNADIQGDVDGVIVSDDIDSISGNSAEQVYVALEDLNGAVAMVAHPYPAATQIPLWRDWRIPLSAFEGVDPTAAAKLYVGVGDGEAGGVGQIAVADIKVVEAEEDTGPKDITMPSDFVKGVPDDGDWPGGEPPAYAIDDNTGTKYLHFKGDFDPDPNTGGTGIRVTPLEGPSLVTELTLTTANDVPGRDPIAFKLSGSNDGIDGPYELIAEGDVVDFAGEEEWPRFTKNETPITFANQTVYAHYELIFTAIRGPVGDSVNSMQIAEIELIGALETQLLTLKTSSTNGGSVTTPGEGSFKYINGTDVEVKATASKYYYFLKWTGSAVDAGKVDPSKANVTLSMDDDYDLKANFAAVNFKLGVSSTDGGSVVDPGEGEFVFGGNYLVSLVAQADPHYHFVNWTCSAVEADMVVNDESAATSILVIGNYSVMANFAIDTHTLDISSTEGGSVTDPGEGSFEYDYGSEVSVTATADEHYHFVNWSGSAVDANMVSDPNSASTSVTVKGDYSLVANFELNTYKLTVSSTEGGSVTVPGEGMFEYEKGTEVCLEATPDEGYRFKYWTGPVADTESASTTVTITEDASVEAVFVKANPDPPDKEVPDKEIPDKEVPDKEVPGKEVPDKEIPDNDVPV